MFILTSSNNLVNLRKVSLITIDDDRADPDDPISEYRLIGCFNLGDPARFIILETFNDDEYDEALDLFMWLSDAIDESVDDQVIDLGRQAERLRKAHRTGGDLYPKIKSGKPAVTVPDEMRRKS